MQSLRAIAGACAHSRRQPRRRARVVGPLCLQTGEFGESAETGFPISRLRSPKTASLGNRWGVGWGVERSRRGRLPKRLPRIPRKLPRISRNHLCKPLNRNRFFYDSPNSPVLEHRGLSTTVWPGHEKTRRGGPHRRALVGSSSGGRLQQGEWARLRLVGHEPGTLTGEACAVQPPRRADSGMTSSRGCEVCP